jgi:putative copper resistance protein D
LIDPQTTLALCRLCFYAGVIATYGISAFSACLAPKRLGRQLAFASAGPINAAALLALGSTIAWLPLEAATIIGSWSAAFDRGTLLVLLFGTAIGTVWLVRLALAAVLAASLPWRSADKARTALAALLLASLALGGHAAMDGDTTRGVIHVLNHAVHLLAGGFWLGSLLMLPACLARLRNPAECADAAAALRRFSRSGHVAVVLVIASGVVNTVLVLGRWPLAPRSPYQMLLAAKIVLVASMTGLALVNRYVFVPDIRKQPDRAIARIRAGIYAELALGAGVLILVGSSPRRNDAPPHRPASRATSPRRGEGITGWPLSSPPAWPRRPAAPGPCGPGRGRPTG